MITTKASARSEHRAIAGWNLPNASDPGTVRENGAVRPVPLLKMQANGRSVQEPSFLGDVGGMGCHKLLTHSYETKLIQGRKTFFQSRMPIVRKYGSIKILNTS